MFFANKFDCRILSVNSIRGINCFMDCTKLGGDFNFIKGGLLFGEFKF